MAGTRAPDRIGSCRKNQPASECLTALKHHITLFDRHRTSPILDRQIWTLRRPFELRQGPLIGVESARADRLVGALVVDIPLHLNSADS